MKLVSIIVSIIITILTLKFVGYIPQWFLAYLVLMTIMYIYATTKKFDLALLKIVTVISVVLMVFIDAIEFLFRIPHRLSSPNPGRKRYVKNIPFLKSHV